MYTHLFQYADQLLDMRVAAIEKFANEVNCDETVTDSLVDRFTQFGLDNTVGYTVCAIAEEDVQRYYDEIVIPHKLAVYRQIISLRASLRVSDLDIPLHVWDLLISAALVHDISKFSLAEDGYINRCIKSDNTEVLDPEMVKYDFDLAWFHHKKCNPHHPEYWVDYQRTGAQASKVRTMPWEFVIEMIADWAGASETYGTPMQEYLNENYHSYPFTVETDDRVRQVLLTGFNYYPPKNDMVELFKQIETDQ